MKNKGVRMFFGVFLTSIILLMCLSVNLNSTKGETLPKTKEVSDSNKIIEYIDTSINDYEITDELKEYAREEVIKNKDEINKVYELINSYRSEKNVKNLKYDEDLSLLATIRAIEMAIYNKFAHVRPNGSSYSSILDELNINTIASGENIAYGYYDIEELCEAWKDSEGHYINLMNYKYTKTGIGYFKYNDTIYWVQLFIK